GVGRLEVFAVGNLVGGAAGDRMRRAMGHARGRGMHQARDAVPAAGRDHVVGADDVGEAVALVAPPGARLGGVVEYRVVAAHGGGDRSGVGKVAADLAHADGVELRVVAAAEAGDLVPAFDQPAAQRLAEEAAATGD